MINGTVKYKDNSRGSFSFKSWYSLMDLSEEENIKELWVFKELISLDCQIRKFEKEFNCDYIKDEKSIYWSLEVGFCESLGEQGFIYTFFYDKFPLMSEIEKDIINYIIEQKAKLNNKILSGYEENHLKALNRIKIKC